MIRNNLTKHEWNSLGAKHNLADGHARQLQDETQRDIIKTLPELFSLSAKVDQEEVQREFCEVFLQISGQKDALKLSHPLFHYSSSISTEVIANYLRLEKKIVGLIHPTFDNIASIFKRHCLHLVPFAEEELLNLQVFEQKLVKVDVVFIVLPNNPTGLELTKETFEKIVGLCKSQNILLIIDACFRLLSELALWSQYEALISSGIEFIVIEDTGKIFPTLDLKIGALLASDNVRKSLQLITDDFLLNVSPFIFKLLSMYAKNESTRKHFSFQKIVGQNRKFIYESIDTQFIRTTNDKAKTSVEWLHLTKKWKSAELCRWLGKRNMHVLPGEQFFWNQPILGDRYIRIALMRPTKQFAGSFLYLVELLQQFERDGFK